MPALGRAEQLGDWFRREVQPRLHLELVYGDDVRWGRAGAWRTRPCPLHGGTNPSFHVHPEHLGWQCHSKCQAKGDVVAFVQRAHGLDFVAAVRHLAELVGEGLPGERNLLSRPKPSMKPRRVEVVYRRPPAVDVARVWNEAAPVTANASVAEYLRSRAIDPERIAERDLARALACGAELPTWAGRRGDDGRWRSWVESGHRLVMPVYGADGALESLRGRLVRAPRADNEQKGLAAAGANVGGLVFANGLGRAMLAGDDAAREVVRRAGIWIAEGEPDYLTLAVAWEGSHDTPAVLGIVSGAWTPRLAARVPDGARVVVAVDDDAAGQKYVAQIAETFVERMRTGAVTLKRWRARA